MVRLEPFKKEDFEKLISWIDNEELLIQFAGAIFEYPLTKEQLVAYISDDKRFAFKIVDLKTNKIIGHAEIYLAEPNVSRLCRIIIGSEEYRGKGIGQQIAQQLLDYSFENLHSESVELNVYDWNIPAIKCYEKVGFKINPDTSKARKVNGKIWTAINMRMQRNERK